MNIIDMAFEYGFSSEQSYIRTFKREFGLTPGELRRTGRVIKITPPLQLFDSNKLADGLFFGPDIVLVPQFHVAGRKYKESFRDDLVLAPRLAAEFYQNDRMKIPNAVNPDVTININSEAGPGDNYFWFMPSIQVNKFDNIPKEFDCLTFPTSLCAYFRFIIHADSKVNMATADAMFNAIDDFMDNKHEKYFLEKKRINFERFDSSIFQDLFCQWEWFAPVVEKTKEHIQKNPDGIIKTYREKTPALRFIGKKFSSPFNDSAFDKILEKLDNCRLDYMFDAIEKKSGDSGGAYISLMRRKDEETLEYWLGLFTPEGGEAPEGYETIDFPKSTLGVCTVYGKRNSIIHYDSDCRKKLSQENLADNQWFFQRFNWRTFFEEDIFGKRLLEYCYFL
jgi:AraC family transcriptional regulator